MTSLTCAALLDGGCSFRGGRRVGCGRFEQYQPAAQYMQQAQNVHAAGIAQRSISYRQGVAIPAEYAALFKRWMKTGSFSGGPIAPSEVARCDLAQRMQANRSGRGFGPTGGALSPPATSVAAATKSTPFPARALTAFAPAIGLRAPTSAWSL